MITKQVAVPAWALAALECPATGQPLHQDGDTLAGPDGTPRARIEHGVIRFALPGDDPSIDFYHAVGGARFHERSQVGYAMTSLDTSVYHAYLRQLQPREPHALIVDVGGGDGRNARPWLEWGQRRVIVIDVAAAALQRFRERVTETDREWLERIVFVEADARRLPLGDGCAARVHAIEALAYLNDDYGLGVRQCARVVARDGLVLIADRDYEATLLARLFYGGGISGLLEQARGRDAWDGQGERRVRSRTFTADELETEVTAAGLSIVERHGVSAISLVVGYLRNAGRLDPADDERLPDVREVLATLGRQGRLRRSHVVVARPAGT